MINRNDNLDKKKIIISQKMVNQLKSKKHPKNLNEY